MKRRSLTSILATLVVLAGALAAFPTQAGADTQYSQQVIMVGDRPVTGRFELAFNNYEEIIVECHDSPSLPEGTICERKGYRVARGTLATKLHTYKVKEGIDGYDYYFIDVDIDVIDHSGSSDYGWAEVNVLNTGPVLKDREDTKSVSADENACDTLTLSMGGGISIVSANMELGHVTFCAHQAAFTRTSDGNPSAYHATRLAGINALTTQRAIKVKAGAKPVFKITVTVPVDDCTAAKHGICTKYDNTALSKTYVVGTSG